MSNRTCTVGDCRRKHYAFGTCSKHYQQSRYSPEYMAWSNAKKRCRNANGPDWNQYGGRGITFSPLWDDFKKFLADVGPRPSSEYTLDRIDVDGNYEPGNVRWATWDVQVNNRRYNRYPQRIAELEQEVLLLQREVKRLKGLVGE